MFATLLLQEPVECCRPYVRRLNGKIIAFGRAIFSVGGVVFPGRGLSPIAFALTTRDQFLECLDLAQCPFAAWQNRHKPPVLSRKPVLLEHISNLDELLQHARRNRASA